MIAKTLGKLGLVAALAGLSTVAIAAETGSDPFGENLGTELRASNAPRDWALAADIIGDDGQYPSDRAELLAKAVAAVPDDTFVQWLALSDPKKMAGEAEDGADRARRLAASDPDNAAAWMPSLVLAVKANDVKQIDAVLGRMAGAKRFDTHFRDYLFVWFDFYARRPASTNNPHAYVQALARATAFPLPAYQRLIGVCDPAKNEGIDTQRLDRCAAIARGMASGDVVITQLIGHSILRLGGRATPDEADAERQLRWLQKQQMVLADDERQMMAGLTHLVDDWRETDNEEAVYRRSTQRAGLSLTPPPGWDWREPKR